MSQKRFARFAGCLFALNAVFFTQQAQAFETLDLDGDGDRVAVIVLAYNDNWTDYAGNWIYDVYLHGLMGKRYDKLFVARGTREGLDADDIRGAFRAGLETGRTLDFMTSTHSNGTTFQLRKGVRVRPDQLLSPLIDESAKERLSLAANFGCNSNPMEAQYLGLGFRSYVGHDGISSGAVAMRDFLRFWLRKCESMYGAVDRTNGHLNRMFTRNPIAKAIYKSLADEESYEAVMTGFGEDQSACR